MPFPAATSIETSIATILHPSCHGPETASNGPTALGVLFNDVPPVLAQDRTLPHSVIVGLNCVPCVGFAVPTQGRVLVNGRPVIRINDFYQCTCGGKCKIVSTIAENIIIGE